jgi:hypothetical protein
MPAVPDLGHAPLPSNPDLVTDAQRETFLTSLRGFAVMVD